MPTRRSNAVNSIANSLFGNTNIIAQNRGFNQQARGQAGIASALLGRAKAEDVINRGRDRDEGLNLVREGGDKELLADFLISDKITPATAGDRRIDSQTIDNRNSARQAIETGDLVLANQLNQVGSNRPIEQFKTGSFGAFDVTSGQQANPELLASKTNLNNAQVDKNISFAAKADQEAEKIAVQTQALIANGGKVPATGSAIAGFYTKLIDVMVDPLKGGNLVVGKRDGKDITFDQLTPEERNKFLIEQRRILIDADPATQAKIMAQFGLDDLPLTPSEAGVDTGEEEGSFFDAPIDNTANFIGNLLNGKKEPQALAPAPVPATTPPQPTGFQDPLVGLPGPQNPQTVNTNQSPQLNLAPTTQTPEASIAASLGPQQPIQQSPQQPPGPAPIAEIPVQQAKENILSGLFAPTVDPKLIERFKQVTSKSLRDRIFDLSNMRQPGDPRNAQIEATMKAMEEELRRRGDL